MNQMLMVVEFRVALQHIMILLYKYGYLYLF